MLIRANNLSKSYYTAKKVKLDVLKSVSLSIEENKISVIIGASGAGKSTLLHLIGGLDRPASGEVFYNNINIFSLSDEKLAKFRNRNIGFIFQFHHLLPEFSALENVAIPHMINGGSLKEASEVGKELLSDVGLGSRLHHKPAELSGGEQQRVAIARALINNPDVILADEPTGNLDSANSEAIHKIIIDLKTKWQKTFIIVTHNNELMALADKVFEMKDGLLL
jgi:lipoprotein-releasing system ATP-binding protein